MEAQQGVKEVVSSIKVIEQEYRVHRPIFEDIKIERPIYTEKKIEVPVGINELINELCSIIAKNVVSKVLDELDIKLKSAIDLRIKEIQVPVIKYVETEKSVEVPKYKDIEIERVKFIDKEVINTILVDKHVINPIFEDVNVERPIFQDRVMINPKFEDVIIQKPKFVEKEIPVIHIKYLDMKGNVEPE